MIRDIVTLTRLQSAAAASIEAQNRFFRLDRGFAIEKIVIKVGGAMEEIELHQPLYDTLRNVLVSNAAEQRDACADKLDEAIKDLITVDEG